jgi:hypothetical protein
MFSSSSSSCGFFFDGAGFLGATLTSSFLGDFFSMALVFFSTVPAPFASF